MFHTILDNPRLAALWVVVFGGLEIVSFPVLLYLGFIASGPIMSPTAQQNPNGDLIMILVVFAGTALMAKIATGVCSMTATSLGLESN